MNFPFFASFIVFILWLSFVLSRNRKQEEKEKESFWEKENRANGTRRRSLDGLRYIAIPFDDLPTDTPANDEKISEYLETLHSLADSPIVNFSGISNTDLKLQYGAPNIDLLMQYDQNYTVLARTLQLWADRLYELGRVDDSRRVLEYAIDTGTDVSGSYRLLCAIYKEQGTPEKIVELKKQAEGIRSASRSIIDRILKEYDP